MNTITVKTAICLSMSCLAVAPKIAYVASDSYIRTYNKSSAFIAETTKQTLNKIGLDTLKPKENKDDLQSIINREAVDRGLDPRLISALIAHESKENADAFSLKGAIGVAQIMPANAKRCGLKKVSELWDTEKNIKCSVQILEEELRTYKNDLLKALNAYSGGPRCVNPKKGGDSPCKETVQHAKEVLRLFAQSFV